MTITQTSRKTSSVWWAYVWTISVLPTLPTSIPHGRQLNTAQSEPSFRDCQLEPVLLPRRSSFQLSCAVANSPKHWRAASSAGSCSTFFVRGDSLHRHDSNSPALLRRRDKDGKRRRSVGGLSGEKEGQPAWLARKTCEVWKAFLCCHPRVRDVELTCETKNLVFTHRMICLCSTSFFRWETFPSQNISLLGSTHHAF